VTEDNLRTVYLRPKQATAFGYERRCIVSRGVNCAQCFPGSVILGKNQALLYKRSDKELSKEMSQ
jgi:NADH:ubiquinone oxidoreductase subunit